MNKHALAALEFPRVREMVLSLLKSPAGEHAAGEWGPVSERREVERLMEETGQMRSFIEETKELDLSGLILPDEILRRARPADACLIPGDIMLILRICVLTGRCRARLKAGGERLPLVSSRADDLPRLSDLKQAIETVLDEEGEFRDGASARLSAIRKGLASVKEEIDSLYGRLLSERSGEDIFQEDIITTRRGRYVLMVKAQAKSRIKGFIHDRTDSGAAVYVEPEEAVGLNNRLSELLSEEEEEKRRLLRLLTDRVRNHNDALAAATSVLGAVDLVQARALFGLQKNFARPELSAGRSLKLSGARHPLLEKMKGKETVPLDLEVEDEQRVLVITGPNTGGKTVVLKTAGLMSLMTQSGLFIPADEGSRLPVFSDIFADIGDEQSLEQSLSTFSAHARNIAEALNQADENCLVIFDELGAGTDPKEGSPLSMAVIEKLLGIGAMTLASTHHGSLVAFAAATGGVVNASMEFDGSTLLPTYRLIMGVPGRSNAREVAGRMGIPEDVISRSRELQPEEERGLDRLVEDLNKRRRQMEEAVFDLSAREKELSSILEEREEELEKLRRGKEKVLAEAREEAIRILGGAKEEVRRIIKKTPRIGGKAHHHLHSLGESMKRDLPDVSVRPSRPLEKEPEIGQMVRIASVAAEGRVREINTDRKTVKLEVRGKMIDVPMEYLEKAGASGRNKPTETKPGRYDTGVEELSSRRLDIRGMRAEEALSLVTRFVDQAWLSGLESVEILHGKGTGKLKEACARNIAGHPGVSSFGPAPRERGGHGVTVINFK